MAATLPTAPQLVNRSIRRKLRKWKFALHDSLLSGGTLSTGNRVRWLTRARGKRVELILDKPGSAQFNLPSSSAEAFDVVGFEVVRCIVAYAEDKTGVMKARWSGPIWTVEIDEPNGRVNVTCVGWDELFEHRELRHEMRLIKRTPDEIAQIVVNTCNAQIANEAYAFNQPAEDLLQGAGDFETSSDYELTGGPPDGIIVSSAISSWDVLGIYDKLVPRLGGRQLRVKHSGQDANKFLKIPSRSGISVKDGFGAFQVEAGMLYRVAGWFLPLSNVGNTAVDIYINYYDANGNGINSQNALLEQISGTNVANPFIFRTVNATFTAPANVRYAMLWLRFRTGSAANGPPGATSTIDMLFDGITITRGFEYATNPGIRPFPITSQSGRNYFFNEVKNSSFEDGSTTGWNTISASTVLSSSVLWAASGTKSMSVKVSPALSTGEYGATYRPVNVNSMVVDKTGFVRARVKIVYNGTNGLQLRIKCYASGLILRSTFVTAPIYGNNKDVILELPFTATNIYVDFDIDIIANAIANEAIEFYVDDVMLSTDGIGPYVDDSTENGRGISAAFEAPSNNAADVGKSVGQVYTRTYAESTKLAQVLRELSDVEWGIDYDVDPLTRTLNTYWGTIKPGTPLRGKGLDKPAVIFGYNVHPNNVASVRDSRDASRLANRVNAQGKSGKGLAQDIDSIQTYGIHEETISLTDVADPAPPQPSILAVYAGSEVAMRLSPFRTITFTPKQYASDNNVPMFLEDFSIGDIIYLIAVKNTLVIGDLATGVRQPLRVFTAAVEIDDNNDAEKSVALTTALSG